jgi:hypothetical protein
MFPNTGIYNGLGSR